MSRACYNAVAHPQNPDSVAIIGDLTSVTCLKNIRRIMLEDEVGRRILRERPVVNSKNIDLEALKDYPVSTFGNAYYRFLKVNKVTPDTRLQVRYVENEELAYIMQRYREIHDFIHTISGLSTTLVDEIALKWVEMANLGIPVTVLSSFFGIFSVNNTQKLRFIRDFLPWAVKHSSGTKKLFLNIYYEKEFLTPIDELRAELGIKPFKNCSKKATTPKSI